MLVLCLDHFIGGISTEREIACSTQLATCHCFHETRFCSEYSAANSSGLRDADEVARGVAERAVARAPGLGRRLLEHLGARRPDLLECVVEVVGAEDRRLQRSLQHERKEGVALGLRTTAVRLEQDDVDVLPRGAN